MFDEKNIPKKTNSGILREIEMVKEDSFINIEEKRRKDLIKKILEGKFKK